MKDLGARVRHACALLLLFVTVGYPSVRDVRADPRQTANDCVAFRTEREDKQLVVHATNECDQGVACKLNYDVRCQNHDGKTTASSSNVAPFRLTGKGARTLGLSAQACPQSWDIEVSWSCR